VEIEEIVFSFSNELDEIKGIVHVNSCAVALSSTMREFCFFDLYDMVGFVNSLRGLGNYTERRKTYE
jgi:hypothetical protein